MDTRIEVFSFIALTVLV